MRPPTSHRSPLACAFTAAVAASATVLLLLCRPHARGCPLALALFACITCCSFPVAARAQSAPVGPQLTVEEYTIKWPALAQRIKAEYRGPVVYALSYPQERGASAGALIDALLREIEATSIPDLAPVSQLDRLDRTTFLLWTKARLLSKMQHGRTDLITGPERQRLAEAVIKNAATAFALIEQIKKEPPNSPSMKWLLGAPAQDGASAEEGAPVPDRTWMMKAGAHAMLWDLGVNKAENHRAARTAWESVDPFLASRFPPASPELEKIVMPYLHDPSNIPHAMYIGIAALTLGFLLVFFTKREPGGSAYWALRVYMCVAAGLTGSGIHGQLNVVSYNGWLSAGGAMALVVLFYLFNPPPPPVMGGGVPTPPAPPANGNQP